MQQNGDDGQRAATPKRRARKRSRARDVIGLKGDAVIAAVPAGDTAGRDSLGIGV